VPIWRNRQSPLPPARKCPLIPRGHLSMCPQRAASLFTLTSSRRFTPVAYSGTSAAAITIPPSREGQTLGLYRGRFCYRHLGAILADTLAEMGIIDGRNDVRKPRLRARRVSECPKTGLRESRKRSMREIKCDHLSLRKAFLTRILTGVMNVRSTLNSIRRHSLSNRPNGTRL